MRPSRHLHLSLLLLLVASDYAYSQQGEVPQRYYIRRRDGVDKPHEDLIQAIARNSIFPINADRPEIRPGLIAQVNEPELGLSAITAYLTSDGLARINQQEYLVLPDILFQPTSGSPLGGGWAMDQFCKPEVVTPCEDTAPVIYIVDTGINPTHPELSSSPSLTFAPGFSHGFNLSISPPTPVDPYQDGYDHGTRMAACIGGRTTGLLPRLDTTATVKSINIYDVPGGSPTTFISQAISGIYSAITDHESRRATPYLKNHVSILLCANSTTVAAGRFGDLDRAIIAAWEAGLHIILSAGNEASPAVLVSPAGASWGLDTSGFLQRYWFGAPPPGSTFYRTDKQLLVVGAYQQTFPNTYALWPSSNTNISGADTIDGYAPGALVPTTLAPADTTLASGTSYSAAYTAALATWVLSQRPWAPPAAVRDLLLSKSVPLLTTARFQVPDLPAGRLSYAAWIHHYYPLPLTTLRSDEPLEDPDGDGVINMIEYYCGLDPRIDDAIHKPRITLSVALNGAVNAEVLLPEACWLGATPSVTWTLQRSTDLQNWTSIPPDTYQRAGTTLPCDGQQKRAKTALPPGPERAYFRLKWTSHSPLL